MTDTNQIWIFLLIQSLVIVFSAFFYRKINRRVSRIEQSIVYQIMEETPDLVNKVVETQNSLYGQGLGPTAALQEARRLHGLEP
jgi:hypothetical protein